MTKTKLTKTEFMKWLKKPVGNGDRTNACKSGIKRFVRLSKGLTLEETVAKYRKLYRSFLNSSPETETRQQIDAFDDLLWVRTQSSHHLKNCTGFKRLSAKIEAFLNETRDKGSK